ncbi:CPBP family intramembrane glutamic endopeptidase [Herbivorax sp. ANBcel31]|uniref:CPBP family intramembrane glutamic endopeptidase n=1 Tax=Herbivorax sp. ANBcel31 TaxID=3069754 RepID=UPI0027B7164E|nr:CPBP family intramembrane glutamic endopeptidase [Herbivorax sp. ANBcel31]MDQ2086661.1 CPBP family intramembrane glutamic endopeptidase [Herbivorax sp. ANBcel31]
MNKKFEMIINVLIYLLVFIGAQLLVSGAAIILYMLVSIYKGDFESDIGHIENEMYQSIPIIYIACFIVSVIAYHIIFKRRKRSMFEAGGFSKINIYKIFILAFVGVAANITIDFALDYINNHFNLEHVFSEYEKIMEQIFASSNIPLLLLSIGILYPVLEEVVFRGFIFNELKKNISLTKAIGIQAFLFGLFHLNAVQGSYAFLLGLLFAYIYLWTGSIWAPIMFHIAINSYSVMSIQFPELMTDNIALVILFAFVFIMGTLFIYKTRKKDIKSDEDNPKIDV